MNAPNNDPFASEPEAVRKKYVYRRMIMNQSVKMPARLAMKLIGPDCAFHLYRGHQPTTSKKKKRSTS